MKLLVMEDQPLALKLALHVLGAAAHDVEQAGVVENKEGRATR
jgi:hypothetical protein